MQSIDRELQGVGSVAIAGHVKPDGDCVGSCLALYGYIKENYGNLAVDIYLEPIPPIFYFMKYAKDVQSSCQADRVYDLFIAADCGDTGRLGGAKKYFDSAKRTLCIDHHISNQGFADVNIIDPKISSTCELLFGLMEEEKVSLETASCIYTGLVHDTGMFQYASTTSKTMALAGKLMDMGVPFTRIATETFYERTFLQNKILGQTLLNSRLLLEGRCVMTVLTLEEFEQYQAEPKELEGVVSQMRTTKGVEVAVLIYETKKDAWKVSMRSNQRVDVSKIAEVFGGGGHVRAAGCQFSGDLDENVGRIVSLIAEQLQSL